MKIETNGNVLLADFFEDLRTGKFLLPRYKFNMDETEGLLLNTLFMICSWISLPNIYAEKEDNNYIIASPCGWLQCLIDYYDNPNDYVIDEESVIKKYYLCYNLVDDAKSFLRGEIKQRKVNLICVDNSYSAGGIDIKRILTI